MRTPEEKEKIVEKYLNSKTAIVVLTKNMKKMDKQTKIKYR